MQDGNVSELIKKWRKKRGLSLSQMSKRVDTSSATLSRYENGWQRFELYSLRKIASAFNCRLLIDFIPLDKYKSRNDTSKSIKDRQKININWKKFKRLFWDKKINQSDILNYPEWAVKRVLEYGNINDVQYLINTFGKKTFIEITKSIKFSSKKTDLFWKNILKRENIKCMKKSSQSKARNYWPN